MIARLLKRIRRARGGTALVEFAIAAPVMLILYFGTIEITQAVIAKRRLNLMVTTLADLTARVKTVGSSDIGNIFGAAGAIMAPMDVSQMQMRISSLVVYPAGNGCIDWSVGQNMAGLTAGSTYQVPATITLAPSTVPRDYIMAEASYPYSPITHYFIATTITLKEGPTYLVPRQSDRVLVDTTVQSPASPCS